MQPRPQGAFPWPTSKARKKRPGDEVVLGVAFLSVVSHSFVLFNRSKKREAGNTLERHVWLTTRCTVRFFFPTHLPAPLSAFVSRFIAWLASGIRSPRHGRGLAARISRNDQWQALAWNLLSARSSPPEFCSYAKISERSRLKGWFTTSHLSKCNWAEGKGFACPPVMSWGFRNLESWVLESGIQLKESGTLITIVIRNPRERSIQPKFPEISVQNSMDRYSPTGKVSKKRVYLLRWTTFPGLNRSGFWLNQDRAPSSTDKGSRIQYLESGIHGVESRFQDSLGFLYMGRSVRV